MSERFYRKADEIRICGLDLREGQSGYQADLDEPHRLIPGPEFADLVASVKENGVRLPVLVRQVRVSAAQGNRLYIAIDGRQRILAAREVCKAAKKADLVLVPYFVQEVSDEFDVILANEFRRQDPPEVKALTVRRYQKMGHSLEKIAKYFGVGVQTLQNWLALLNLTPEAKQALATGKVNRFQAAQIGKKPASEQGAAVRKQRQGPKGVAKRQIDALIEKFAATDNEPHESTEQELFAAALSYVRTGDKSELDKWPSVRKYL